jgi:hypothetical protein
MNRDINVSLGAVLALGLACTFLIGCPPPRAPQAAKPAPAPAPVNTAPITSTTLRSATTVVVHEEVLNVGKDYNILVGGRKVGTVSGKNLKILTGDVFKLKLPDGTILASEKEEKRYFVKFNRAATFQDSSNTVTGYLAEDRISNLFSLYYVFYFYDAQRKEIGKSEKLTNSSLGSHKIYDASGKVAYTIKKHWRPLGDHKYTITVNDPNSAIDVYHAILLVCIEDAIGDAAAAKDE